VTTQPAAASTAAAANESAFMMFSLGRLSIRSSWRVR
jgi:hypothetical protein